MIALLLALALYLPQAAAKAPEPWGWNDLVNWCSANGDACMRLAAPAAAPANYRPSPVTPGVSRELTKAQVCGTRWGLDKRHVTLAMKQHVAKAYGIPWSQHSKYEFDHLIPRELGGADDESNLWPQSWTGQYNAHQKDQLENALHKAVCSGQLTLEFAQDAIASDWVSAYRLYVVPAGPQQAEAPK